MDNQGSTPASPYWVGPAKAKAKLNWVPKISFDKLVAVMVREDLKAAERDEHVKKHGYKSMDCNA